MGKFIVVHSIKVAKDFTPETFAGWVTVGPRFRATAASGRTKFYQVCECFCGSAEVVLCESLVSGKSTNCGCIKNSNAKRRFTKHGKTRTQEYKIWKAIKYRCYGPNCHEFQNYGGRGITVCDRWLCPENGFANFYADMGPRPSPKHSIDRIDVNGNYCPENCRWATSEEQARNRRNNRVVTYNGKTQCVSAWAEELGISVYQVRRLYKK